MPGRYQPYLEYKDSGSEWLGDIPKQWNTFDGKRIFKNRRELSLESDEQLAASQKYGVVPQSLMMKLNDSKVMLALKGTSSFRHVEKNDFVISLRSFEGGIEHSNYDGCVSPAYTVLCATKYIVPSFYRYLFKSRPFIAALQSTTDSLRDGKSITFDQFGALPLVSPSPSEQEAIANFLDRETAKIDTLIEKQQQLTKLLKEKRQAVISHAVTKGLNPGAPMRDSGIEWLGEVPEHWDVSKFNYEIDFLEGPGILAVDFCDEGVPLLRIQNVKGAFVSGNFKTFLAPEKVMSKWNHFRVELGDLIISCSASTGLVSEVRQNTVGTVPYTGLIRLRPRSRRISKDFIRYLVQSELFFEQINVLQTGATIQHFGPAHLQQMFITMPPINEQKTISNIVDESLERLDILIGKVEQAIELMQERRVALISAAVAGKIDVRHHVSHPAGEQNSSISAIHADL